MFCASLQRRDPPLKFALCLEADGCPPPQLSRGESEGLMTQITEALGEQAASLQVWERGSLSYQLSSLRGGAGARWEGVQRVKLKTHQRQAS